MAERRMYARSVVHSDAFLSMPPTSQNLYFHLGIVADDDGFVSNPRMIMRMVNSTEDDLKILLAKRFVLGFESGIVVIKHWKINNYIQKDRYKRTLYQEEFNRLGIKKNGSYTEISNTQCIQDVYKVDTQDRLELGKDSIGKLSEGKMNEGLEDIICFYRNNVFDQSSIAITTLNSYLDDFSKEIIMKAIEIACKRNKGRLDYIEGILKDWRKKGYSTIEEVENERKSVVVGKYGSITEDDLDDLYDN